MANNSRIVNADGTTRELRQIWGKPTGTTLAPISTKAIEFDGNDDYIEVGDHEVFSFVGTDPNDAPFSIAAWVYVPPASQGAIVAKNSGNGNPSDWFFAHNSGQIQVIIFDGSGANLAAIRAFSAAGALTANSWHHVAMTYSGSRTQAGIEIYLDGALATNTRDNPAAYNKRINTNSPVRIGANAAGGIGNDFEQFIADVCIFDKELSLSEMQELYNVADSGRIKDMEQFSAFSNVVSWWKMGDDDNTGTNGIIDSVGNYHGTLQNNAKIVSVKNLKSEYKKITI